MYSRRKENIEARARYALKKGIIKRECCNYCGNEKSEMHHTNYNFPLKVIWLCRLHHKQIHCGKISTELIECRN